MPARRVEAGSNQPRRTPMDWNRIEGTWKQAKGEVKEQWGKLTDDDLDVIHGKRDQRAAKIQQRGSGIRIHYDRHDVDAACRGLCGAGCAVAGGWRWRWRKKLIR